MRDLEDDDIAILGYAFDFPAGMNSDEKFWEVLDHGKDIIQEIPKTRWDWRRIYDADPNAEGKSYSYHGAFLDHIEYFDANAFRITPIEAKSMDPQQRLVLKTAWRAMENSNLNIEQLKHSDTGVFIGATMDDYLQLQTRIESGKHINRYTHFGAILNDISGRVSYVFGFQGPSMTIDTACSSSLTAVDSAIKALKEGDCNLALAGGVNIILTEEMYIKFSRTQMLSKTGSCKTFDDSADGYVRGEGCGILALQKLKDAKKSGRPIVAVIRGSSVNHNGNSGGLTVPSGKSQVMLINRCMKKAGVSQDEIDYIEAHGTGTQLGDKIEVNALQEVFQARKSPLLIGSVKSNIGHLESAAGMAGVIKVLLCMKHNKIVPSIHCNRKNQKINWENSPVDVVTESVTWNHDKKIAGVSAFGASGSNAHLILQNYEQEESVCKISQQEDMYLAISAKSKPSLLKLSISLYQCVKDKEEQEIRTFCQMYTTVRSNYRYRIMIFGTKKSNFIEAFEQQIYGLQKGTENERRIEEYVFEQRDNDLLSYLQLSKENETYRNLVDTIKMNLSFSQEEQNEKKMLIMEIAFCQLLTQIGYQKYKIVGNERMKFAFMLTLQKRGEDKSVIDAYLKREPDTIQVLHNYENDRYQEENYIDSKELKGVNKSLQARLLEIAAIQFECGGNIRWNCLYPTEQVYTNHLPEYQFDEQYYWVDYQRHAIDDLQEKMKFKDELAFFHMDETEDQYNFIFQLNKTTKLVQEHRIHGKEVLVGTFQLQLFQEIATRFFGQEVAIREMFFAEKVEPARGRLLKLIVEKGEESAHLATLFEQSESGEWIKKTVFTIEKLKESMKPVMGSDDYFCGELVAEKQFYHSLLESGLSLGEDYQVMKAIAKSEKEAIAVVNRSNMAPAILDSASQLLYLFGKMGDLYVPYYFSTFEQWEDIEQVDRVEAKLLEKTEDELRANLYYYAGGNLVANYINYHLKHIHKSSEHILQTRDWNRSILPDGTKVYQKNVQVAETTLQDHVVYHRFTIPGAYFIAQIMELAKEKFNQHRIELRDISFYHAMVLEKYAILKEMVQSKKTQDGYAVTIYSRLDEDETYLENAKMNVKKLQISEQVIQEHESQAVESLPCRKLEREILKNANRYDRAKIIEIQWKIGLNLSDTFHWMDEAFVSCDGIVANLSNQAFDSLREEYGTPPGFVDTAVQVLGLFKNVLQEELGAYIPLSIDRVIQYDLLSNNIGCIVTNVRDAKVMLTADVIYYNRESYNRILEFQGMTLMKADGNKFGNRKGKDSLIKEEIWTPYEGFTEPIKQTQMRFLEIRLGVQTKKILVTNRIYQNNEYAVMDKKVFDANQNDECYVYILEQVKNPNNLVVVLTDSTNSIRVKESNQTEISMYSEYVTRFYLDILKLLQKTEIQQITLCFATKGVCTQDTEKANVLGGIIWGLIRSIQLELADVKIQLIDIDKKWYEAIDTMSQCVNTNQNQLMIENNQIFMPMIVDSVIGAVGETQYIFDAEKCYVIIGGFGALGLETCKELIANGVKRLIVVGRSPFDQKKTEYESLVHGNEDVMLTYYQLDMSQAEADCKLYQILSVEKNVGGVIYAAGVVQDKIFANYTQEDIRRVYDSKIAGIINLAMALESVNYDFCVCFSSIVSVMGAAGQSVYGAANCFIDTFCKYMQRQGKNMFSVQWGPWSEIGMFARIDQVSVKRYQERNIYAMEKEQALEEFLRVLTQEKNQIILKQHETTKYLESTTKPQNESETKKAIKSTKDRVKDIIAKSIGLDQEKQLEENRSLIDMGVDSLMMIEIRMKLNKQFHAKLSLDEFFNHMTIEKLSKLLDSQSE